MADPVKDFKSKRRAPSAKQRFRNGTFISYFPNSGSLNDQLNIIEGKDPGIFWSPATIEQEVKNNYQDTTYTEYPPYRYGTIVQPRKASNKDLDKSEYNILNRRFEEAKSVRKQPSLGEMLEYTLKHLNK